MSRFSNYSFRIWSIDGSLKVIDSIFLTGGYGIVTEDGARGKVISCNFNDQEHDGIMMWRDITLDISYCTFTSSQYGVAYHYVPDGGII